MKQEESQGRSVSEAVDELSPPLGARLWHSLQGKGFVFIGLLLTYSIFLATFVLQQKDAPLNQFREYQRLEEAEAALVQADLAAFHIVTALFADLNPADMEAIVRYFSVLREQYIALQKLFPERADAFRMLVESMPNAVADPTEDNLLLMHRQLARAKYELDGLMELNRKQREALMEEYRVHSNAATVTALLLGVLGLALLGVITTLFFTNLRKDLLMLRNRVTETMEGYRGPGLPVTRKDEVGDLIAGVNHMTGTLHEREKELEIERRKSFYHEKMAAIEALAGGIAHEIGNPISGISGLAQEIKTFAEKGLDTQSRQNLESILDYSDGLVRITHDLSKIAEPMGGDSDLFDMNYVIENACGLLKYDTRWDGVEFKLELDPQLPAVNGISEQFSQLINNLLCNALDATEGVPDQQACVGVRTETSQDQRVRITIWDNGSGMDEQIQMQAFDPFFTTKPPGKGTGLGLPLCWSIVNGHSGDINIESTLGEGTRIEVLIPLSVAVGRAS